MKDVFIKYNPYKLVTTVQINSAPVKSNSKLNICDDKRLQEWIEELPQILLDECNSNSFNIVFHGTNPDYEDLRGVLDASVSNGLKFNFTLIQAKETAQKEELIRSIFKDIQKGPIDALKRIDVINAFKNAENNEFEVSVIATVSAGKSTLINAMLGQELMPSKNAACTATITRIKDNNQPIFQAEAKDETGRVLESHSCLDLHIMKRLNDEPSVSTINVTGCIPFVDAEKDMELVLVDTPGPNNARNREHEVTQRKMLSESSKALVLYIMNATQLSVNDDNALLHYVAQSMKVGGKQSKDRFIFVVNKIDEYDPSKETIMDSLNNVRDYLKSHGIFNPNIFPTAAKPALMIRRKNNGEELTKAEIREINYKVDTLNDEEMLHMEKYAPLPPSLRGEINNMLDEARRNNDAEAEALIHTGVVSVELAIQQYVRKYAKTAKIKNVVDTFIHRLDDAQCYEQVKKELATNTENHGKVATQLKNAQIKVDSANEAKKFESAVDKQLKVVRAETAKVVVDIVKKFQAQVRQKIEGYRNKQEIPKDSVSIELKELSKFGNSLQPNLQVELEKAIDNSLTKIGQSLLDEYRAKVAALAEELKIGGLSAIEPLKFIQASINDNLSNADSILKSKEVEDGGSYQRVGKRLWYTLWLVREEEWVPKFKTVQFVKGPELANKVLSPLEVAIYDNGESARKHAERRADEIAGILRGNFKELDNLLKKMLKELESYATDTKKAEGRVKESQVRLDWINGIKARVEAILEI